MCVIMIQIGMTLIPLLKIILQTFDIFIKCKN